MGDSPEKLIEKNYMKENLLPEEENSPGDINRNKSLKQRFFGPVDAGSIRGSIFSLSILSLGSGCLALPQKFGQMSILVSAIEIIVAGLASYWTLNLMIIAADKHKVDNYSKLVHKLFGRPLSLFLEITMLVYLTGILILYQVICKKIF